jgi:hypothetical protein
LLVTTPRALSPSFESKMKIPESVSSPNLEGSKLYGQDGSQEARRRSSLGYTIIHFGFILFFMLQ